MKIANFTLKTADTSDNKTFAFPGSTNHYLPLLYFNIEYMWLKIKPNLESRTLSDCEQRLKIVARRDIEKIDLDIAEMKIHKITSSHIAFDEGNFTNNNGDGQIDYPSRRKFVRGWYHLPQNPLFSRILLCQWQV
jgi:hypothetical protein